jgi:hypothetical protein
MLGRLGLTARPVHRREGDWPARPVSALSSLMGDAGAVHSALAIRAAPTRGARSVLALIAALAVASPAPAQTQLTALAGTRVDWSRWERTVADSVKAALMTRLDTQATRMARFGARLRSHLDGAGELDLVHLVDFTGDGIDDVIVEGQAGESEILLMYQDLDGAYVRSLVASGRLAAIHRRLPWLPVTLTVFRHGCCDDVRDFVVDYAWDLRGDTLSYAPVNRLLSFKGTKIPAASQGLTAFRVGASGCDLRTSPERDDAPRAWSSDPLPGNRVAHYAEGSRGAIVTSQVDAAGDEWWFVVFKAGEPPAWELYGEHRRVRADLIGWVQAADCR